MHPMGEDRALPRFEAVLKSMEQYLQPLFPLLSCPPEPRYCPGLPPEGLRTTGLLEPWGRRGMVSLHPHRCAQVPSIVTPRARVGGGLRVKASSASASELHGELSGWLWAWGGARSELCPLGDSEAHSPGLPSVWNRVADDLERAQAFGDRSWALPACRQGGSLAPPHTFSGGRPCHVEPRCPLVCVWWEGRAWQRAQPCGPGFGGKEAGGVRAWTP